VDVSRGKYPPETRFLRYAFHISYFPHIIIGPIETYPAMSRALDSRRITWAGISGGAVRAVWGLFKKFVVAARAGVVVGAISADPEAFRGAYALAAVVLYSVQLYADFSGGIDLVLGASEILGLRLSENFDAPWFSCSVQEFWRRWHITLGAWLREYVYIPLGGNRKGKLRKICNLLITFLVSGLWHGVHYLLWGLFNGIFVCFGEKLRTGRKWLDRLGTFLVITLLWAFFVWQDTAVALRMIGSIFTVFNYGQLPGGLAELGLVLSDWILLALGTVAFCLADSRRQALRKRYDTLSPAAGTAVVCLLALAVLIFGMYGIGFDASAFIYGGF
jgi:D-alanyl-lipoteichoic acid acyltransferase DltB (MBOAT superfamily)